VISPDVLAQRAKATDAMHANLIRLGLLPSDGQIVALDLDYGRYTWSVALAWRLVAVPDRRIWTATQATFGHLPSALDATAVSRADVSQPGIVAPMFHLDMQEWQYISLDGNHRLAKAMELGKPFPHFRMNPVESWLCVIEHPAPGESAYYSQHLFCPEDCPLCGEQPVYLGGHT
jgi:hypothetical protein